jgi:hypothetical protein
MKSNVDINLWLGEDGAEVECTRHCLVINFAGVEVNIWPRLQGRPHVTVEDMREALKPFVRQLMDACDITETDEVPVASLTPEQVEERLAPYGA